MWWWNKQERNFCKECGATLIEITATRAASRYDPYTGKPNEFTYKTCPNKHCASKQPCTTADCGA